MQTLIKIRILRIRRGKKKHLPLFSFLPYAAGSRSILILLCSREDMMETLLIPLLSYLPYSLLCPCLHLLLSPPPSFHPPCPLTLHFTPLHSTSSTPQLFYPLPSPPYPLPFSTQSPSQTNHHSVPKIPPRKPLLEDLRPLHPPSTHWADRADEA